MTIYEILAVALIISILVLVALPNFISNKDRAKDSAMESNARALRIMLETYHIDNKIYPENLLTLGHEATNKNYNKIISNEWNVKSERLHYCQSGHVAKCQRSLFSVIKKQKYVSTYTHIFKINA